LDPVVGKDARRTCFLARRRELDATFEVERPEWRVYAANPDGDGVRLVAVECAVPLELSDRAPEGFVGRRDEWHRAEEFGLVDAACVGLAVEPGRGACREQSLRPVRRSTMPRFVIEREIPGAGQLSEEELRAISQKSCGVLQEMGPTIQWVQSYVVDDKVYCIYIAPDEAAVREHARQGGFPANRVSEVRAVIDPTTAE
jgi:hypothetical protein